MVRRTAARLRTDNEANRYGFAVVDAGNELADPLKEVFPHPVHDKAIWRQ